MHTIAIYFGKPGKLDYPFHDPMYYQSYRAFAQYCREQGTTLYIVRGNSYLGNMTFASGWEFIGEELEPVTEPFPVDCIYRFCEKPPFVQNPGELFVNNLDFSQKVDDKWQTYESFAELMPVTYQITPENWQEVVEKISTPQIVLKPVHGGGGEGIMIADTESVDVSTLELTQPYLAQEFIDSSGGIPGLCEGYHDLRIMFFNEMPKLAFLRIPKTGSLLSNISQGASARAVPIDQVPASILDMARAVDLTYCQYQPRHYTIDFFMGRERPYLVETNTQPGFPRLDAEGKEFQLKYYDYLHALLTEAIEEKTHGN